MKMTQYIKKLISIYTILLQSVPVLFLNGFMRFSQKEKFKKR
jgi:hypothetical protein